MVVGSRAFLDPGEIVTRQGRETLRLGPRPRAWSSKDDKVAYFGLWADSARDRSYRKEALRICAERANAESISACWTCPQVQQALTYLEQNADRTSVTSRFGRALDIADPPTRAREVEAACAAIALATAIIPCRLP
ncbi:hypothetical protein [Sinorhizobium arboris]|uniref:hypothetical protein n=1 Tax=Sinorhizobium arboris TaxID=76745 RepID=UPI0004136D21|nr:hypothetical protein [Sinorhizobium arboris]